MCLGMPGRFVRLTEDPSGHVAIIDFDGSLREVNVGIVAQEATPAEGEWLLVHMGIALQRLDPSEARHRRDSLADLMEQFEAAAAGRERDG